MFDSSLALSEPALLSVCSGFFRLSFFFYLIFREKSHYISNIVCVTRHTTKCEWDQSALQLESQLFSIFFFFAP